MTLRELCEQAHAIAEDRGFWDKETYPNGMRNIPELLMLIVTELGEACEALRHKNRQGNIPCNLGYACDACPTPDACWRKDTFEDELADVFIRLGDMCQALHIDIEWYIKNKMKYNKTRPRKHGKEF